MQISYQKYKLHIAFSAVIILKIKQNLLQKPQYFLQLSLAHPLYCPVHTDTSYEAQSWILSTHGGGVVGTEAKQNDNINFVSHFDT